MDALKESLDEAMVAMNRLTNTLDLINRDFERLNKLYEIPSKQSRSLRGTGTPEGQASRDTRGEAGPVSK